MYSHPVASRCGSAYNEYAFRVTSYCDVYHYVSLESSRSVINVSFERIIDVYKACRTNSNLPLFLKEKRPGFAGLYPNGYPGGIRFVFTLTTLTHVPGALLPPLPFPPE